MKQKLINPLAKKIYTKGVAIADKDFSELIICKMTENEKLKIMTTLLSAHYKSEMTEEQYWKQDDGEVIAVGDMSANHAKSVLRKMIKKSRQRGQDVLVMRDKIDYKKQHIFRQISNTLGDIKRDLL